MKKIGILGTGDVAKALGAALLQLGHEVRLGSRSAAHPGATAWADEQGAKASTGTFADAAKFGDLIILATLGTANEPALKLAGPENFAGKIVIDTTNPLDISAGPARLKLAIHGEDSAGERVQALLPAARVVKAFNTIGHPYMFRPQFAGGPPDMFICGNEAAAKQEVTALLKEFGWGTVDIGAIDGARYLEAMCVVWVRYGGVGGSWHHAFKLLR